MSPQFHNLQELRHSASLATKVFIQRDYTEGTICKFQTKFPAELESRIERTYFEDTVKTLNNYYAEAEKIGGQSYLEGCLACATAYIIFLCMETRYEKVLKKISKYIQEQNEKIYAPRGLLITDPIERGMRVIEISIFEDRGSSGSSSGSSSTSSSSVPSPGLFKSSPFPRPCAFIEVSYSLPAPFHTPHTRSVAPPCWGAAALRSDAFMFHPLWIPNLGLT
ncbi:hypothetical protein JZ751_007957 [Albula glossodonta]|uniref:Golgin subfamily A member 7/ERF4 domain-containing protein n=1 Tax=Albula glossodonta TaxID=121402 RepID=A0A8T2P1D9_9TELE|nr:hypothetical protein JZ751_007957 [Albula glossodonta]